MNQAEWKDVGSLVVSLIGRQPAPMQIFSWLLIVFALLMLIEGLRATFLPRRVVAQIRRRGPLEEEPARRTLASVAPDSAPTESVPRRFNASTTAARNAKRVIRTVNRHEPTRPKIRRISSYFEYAGATDGTLAPQIQNDAGDRVLDFAANPAE